MVSERQHRRTGSAFRWLTSTVGTWCRSRVGMRICAFDWRLCSVAPILDATSLAPIPWETSYQLDAHRPNACAQDRSGSKPPDQHRLRSMSRLTREFWPLSGSVHAVVKIGCQIVLVQRRRAASASAAAEVHRAPWHCSICLDINAPGCLWHRLH